MDIRIEPVADDGPVVLPEPLGFGRVFTRRMFTERYDPELGWHDAAIHARRAIQLDPSAQVLHSGQAIFEGTKAYLRPDGNLNLFRVEANARRFNRSAERMGMAQLPEDRFIGAIEALVRLERAWVPRTEGASLYIRPVMVGTESTLEVRASRTFLHYVVLSPSAPFFSGGFNPVSVRVAEDHVRAVVRGTGAVKTVGNYAASLAATEAARASGFQQVLWLDAVERKYIEEAGAMNVAFVYDNREIVTPSLGGSILPGITRDSILRLANDLGFGVRESRLTIDEVLADIRNGSITEAFCMGTAAVVAPIGEIAYQNDRYAIGGGSPVAAKVHRALTDIQYGRVPDPYGWIRVIETQANVLETAVV